MKTNNRVHPLRIAATPDVTGKGVMENHQLMMSRGETIFHLRDVHRYWSTPRLSNSEMEDLEQRNLIQRSTTGICAIRLTEEGERVKNWHPPKRP